MQHVGTLVTKWIGGLLLLAVPYVLVCGFFAPRGVQFLNRAVCERTYHIDNRGAVPRDVPGRKATNSIELTCKSQGDLVIVNATGRFLEVAALFVAAGFGFLLASSRLKPHLGGPTLGH